MLILTFTSHYLPGYKGGGPIKTIKNLCDTTGTDGVQYRIITADRDLGDFEPFSMVNTGNWNRIGNAEVFYVSPGSVGAKQIKNFINKQDYDLIYLNSFFSFRFSIYPQFWARIKKKTVIIGPRGELSHGAMQLKSFKKKIFIFLYRLFGLHRNIIFQASSEYEKDDIKQALGKRVDIVIADDIGAQEFAKSIPHKKAYKNRLIFISRISPMKNLLDAIKILKQVKSPVVYDIYGPIEDDEYWEKCKVAMEELPSHIEANYKGSLKPQQVIQTMSTYDMFFMPTLGENYGHVIAEAFCAALPVLITDRTPWRQLETKGIGWDIPLNQQDRFVQVIDQFAALTYEGYQAKRQRVLDWAKHKFSQRDAIEANIAMFNYAYEKNRK